MKHIVIFAFLMFMFCFSSFGQLGLEKNEAINAQTRENQFKVAKLNYIEVKKIDIDTSGEYLSQAAVQMAEGNKGKYQKLIESINDTLKTQQKSNGKQSAQNDLLARIAKAESLLDSIKNAQILLNLIKKNSDLKATSDTIINEKDNLEFNILFSLESIRFYRDKLDSSKTITSTNELADSVAFLLSNLEVLSERVKNISYTLKGLTTQFKKVNYELLHSDTASAKLLNELKDKLNDARQDIKFAKGKLVSYDSLWNHVSSKYIQVKSSKSVQVAALPALNFIPGLKDINGSVNLIGSSVPNTKTGNYIEFGLFSGVLKNADSTNPYSIFLSEVSNYAFYFKSTVGFSPVSDTNKATRLALNTSIYFANKQIAKDSASGIKNNFNSSVFHGKFGLEYIVFRNLLSAYFNANALSAVTTKSQFDKRFGLHSDIITFADFGFKMLLGSSMKLPDGMKLFFDLNFLINTDQLKSFNPQVNDILIPNIGFGVRANLGKI